MNKTKIYTDGGCNPNPGPGGYGLVMVSNAGLKLWYGGYSENTTNNIMELKALLTALELAEVLPLKITIYCDSKYAIKCTRVWSYGWKKNKWLKRDGSPISNLEIIQQLHNVYDRTRSRVSIKHIKAHKGHIYNEMADRLATKAMKTKQVELITIDKI